MSEILSESARTLDFGQPVALLMLGILGQIPDSARPGLIVDTLMGALPPGSYLALSDGTDTSRALNQAIAAYNQHSASSYHLRSPEQIGRFFHGLTRGRRTSTRRSRTRTSRPSSRASAARTSSRCSRTWIRTCSPPPPSTRQIEVTY